MRIMNGITIYHKIKEIDNNVIICFTTADKNYIQQLQKGIIDIEKIVLYKPGESIDNTPHELTTDKNKNA